MELKDDNANEAIAAKDITLKNKRIACKWKQLAKAIELQKSEKSEEINETRNKLLTQRNKIETRTVSMTANSISKMTFESVCDNVFATLRTNKLANLTKDGKLRSVQRTTQSFEKKKASRKNVSLSLNELQKKSKWSHASRNDREQDIVEEVVEEKVEKEKRPKSAFDLTEAEKGMNPKLYTSPVSLPKIYLQKQFPPKSRNFAKDEEYKRRISVTEDTWKDIHHCRHLRIQPVLTMKRSRTMPELRRNTRN